MGAAAWGSARRWRQSLADPEGRASCADLVDLRRTRENCSPCAIESCDAGVAGDAPSAAQQRARCRRGCVDDRTLSRPCQTFVRRRRRRLESLAVFLRVLPRTNAQVLFEGAQGVLLDQDFGFSPTRRGQTSRSATPDTAPEAGFRGPTTTLGSSAHMPRGTAQVRSRPTRRLGRRSSHDRSRARTMAEAPFAVARSTSSRRAYALDVLGGVDALLIHREPRPTRRTPLLHSIPGMHRLLRSRRGRPAISRGRREAACRIVVQLHRPRASGAAHARPPRGRASLRTVPIATVTRRLSPTAWASRSRRCREGRRLTTNTRCVDETTRSLEISPYGARLKYSHRPILSTVRGSV